MKGSIKEMEGTRIQERSIFSGEYRSDGGSLFVGNTFNAAGQICFDSSSGTSTSRWVIDIRERYHSHCVDNKLPPSIYDIPNPLLSPHFTGRSNELEEIGYAFNSVSDDTPARCVVYAMPGSGKTQLVLKYATLASKESRYIFWVSAASVEKLNRDFTKLADLLHLPGRHNLDQAAKTTTIRGWLEDTADARSWLLVLDNVTLETNSTLRNILPRRNNSGKLLFTTRTENIADSLVMVSGKTHKIALQPPCIEDAITMLLAAAERGRERVGQAELENITSVIKSVGSLSLAINQAGSYMKESGSSAKDVLNVYRSEEKEEVGKPDHYFGKTASLQNFRFCLGKMIFHSMRRSPWHRLLHPPWNNFNRVTQMLPIFCESFPSSTLKTSP